MSEKTLRHKYGHAGGYLVGRSHAHDGIKAVNKSNGDPIEMEGGEVVITKPAVEDNSLHEFEGEKLTNRQILSRINQSGGGVSFADGGELPKTIRCSGKTYKYGGETKTDYEIVSGCGCKHSMEQGGETSKTYMFNNVAEEVQFELVKFLYLGKAGMIKNNYVDNPNDPGITATLTPEGYQRTLDFLKKNDPDKEFYVTSGGSIIYDATDDKFARGGELHAKFLPTHNGYDHKAVIPAELTDTEKRVIDFFRAGKAGHIYIAHRHKSELHNLLSRHIIYTTGQKSVNKLGVFLTSRGHHAVEAMRKEYKSGGKLQGDEAGDTIELQSGEAYADFSVYHGPHYQYTNAYAINKAIEELLDKRADTDLDTDEKKFISYYSGYGGLEKFGATGKGLLFEYFTPSLIAQKMWGLAYKYGYKGGSVFEPSAGVGEFFKYAPPEADISGYEINKYSARICKILYPHVSIENKYFEEKFIRNRDTIRDKVDGLPKYDLVIGNPPYGKFEGIFAGMGEKSYTRATNYIDYFIFRGLDLVVPGGLLIYIIGAEVAAGGIPFLQQGSNTVKTEIAEKSELLDAYRLPNGVFERTDVLTDIIVLKKK